MRVDLHMNDHADFGTGSAVAVRLKLFLNITTSSNYYNYAYTRPRLQTYDARIHALFEFELQNSVDFATSIRVAFASRSIINNLYLK